MRDLLPNNPINVRGIQFLRRAQSTFDFLHSDYVAFVAVQKTKTAGDLKVCFHIIFYCFWRRRLGHVSTWCDRRLKLLRNGVERA